MIVFFGSEANDKLFYQLESLRTTAHAHVWLQGRHWMPRHRQVPKSPDQNLNLTIRFECCY